MLGHKPKPAPTADPNRLTTLRATSVCDDDPPASSLRLRTVPSLYHSVQAIIIHAERGGREFLWGGYCPIRVSVRRSAVRSVSGSLLISISCTTRALRTMRLSLLASRASLTTSEPHGSVRRQLNAQQRASSEGVRLKWGKSGAKPALSRSCNRAAHGSGARMPASAWMPASRGLQDGCNGSSQRHLMAVKSLRGL